MAALVLLAGVFPAHADPPGQARVNSSAPARRLDLSTPALSRVYSRSELRYILAQPDPDEEDVEGVSVQGEHYVVVPMGQFRAIPWALTHPTEAWRIFAPVVQP
jgi:hypothetical protein